MSQQHVNKWRTPSQQRILQAAEDQFFRYGYRRLRMDDIAAAASASKRTLYEAFPSKRAILKALFIDVAHDVRGTIERTRNPAPSDVIEYLRIFLTDISKAYNRLSYTCLDDVRIEHPHLYNSAQLWLRNVGHQHVDYLLQVGRDNGIIRKDALQATRHVLWLAATSALHRTSPTNLVDLSPVPVDTMISVLLQGISRRK